MPSARATPPAGEHEDPGEQSEQDHAGNLGRRQARFHRYRHHGSRDSERPEHVEQVAPDHVARHDLDLPAPPGGHRGRELGERGSDCDQGETDDRFGGAERPGDVARASDEQFGADEQRHQAHAGGRQVPPERRLVLPGARAGGGRRFGVAAPPYGEDVEQGEQSRECESDRARNHARNRQRPEEDGGGEHEPELAAQQAARHRERGHHRGDPQDQSQVGRVAADDVPHREPRALAEHRYQTGADLRRRSAVGDDGQPDHQRADAEPPREARGAVHEPVRPVGESGKPEEREDAGEENQAGTPARGRLRAAPEDRAFGARL